MCFGIDWSLIYGCSIKRIYTGALLRIIDVFFSCILSLSVSLCTVKTDLYPQFMQPQSLILSSTLALQSWTRLPSLRLLTILIYPNQLCIFRMRSILTHNLPSQSVPAFFPSTAFIRFACQHLHYSSTLNCSAAYHSVMIFKSLVKF